MTEPLLIAQSRQEIFLLPHMANRHGLITGATGTGKTVTLQAMAESFSRAICPEVGGQIIRGALGSLPGGNNGDYAAR